MAGSGSWPGLVGRRVECDRLSGAVAAAKAGRSQVLVLRGEAGIGKTALLDFLLGPATGCQVARAAGVESEMELPFAGLHQLCAQHLHRLDALPSPQREALGTAFGLRPGTAPDRFLVGLAVLTLLSEVAEERPLVCAVDDVQWLDTASVQTLEFVARRLVAEPVALVFAVRDTGDGTRLQGLPQLVVGRLGNTDAGALLRAAFPATLDPRVRDRILAESSGNPLALLELPRGLSAAELAFGGATSAVDTPLMHRLEQEFVRQVAPLSDASRRMLLIAAAEPMGDVLLVRRASRHLGIGPDAARAAEAADLIVLADRVRFRHPLVRSAVYRSSSPGDRRVVHAALADVTDPELDPDRRAWHRARATVGPDEDVATELERSADRALSHGGLAAAAAYLEQAAALTPDPGRRVRRSLDAARASVHAGAFGDAATLLATAEEGPLDEAERALIDLLRAEVSFAADHGNGALPLLLAAARRLEPLDANLARDTYLDALSAALFAGRLAEGPGARRIAGAARRAPAPALPRKGALLLDGLAVLFTDGYGPAAPLSRRAVAAFAADDLTMDEALRSAWLAAATAVSLWDDGCWDVLTRRHLELAEQAGALSVLPLALNTRAVVHLFTGDLPEAAALVDHARSLGDVTGNTLTPYGRIGLLALRGDAERAEQLIDDHLADVVARGEGVGISMLQWAHALLCNGLGRYADALTAARDAAAEPLQLGPPKWALAELVEAAVRSGELREAAGAMAQLADMARASGTEWALGIEASRRALFHDGSTADGLYREAIRHLERTSVRVELARARLLYGEWLRREGRRVDARAQLRAAFEALSAMGADAFADRARRELLATGETVRKRSV